MGCRGLVESKGDSVSKESAHCGNALDWLLDKVDNLAKIFKSGGRL
jgi:hypothetical protein